VSVVELGTGFGDVGFGFGALLRTGSVSEAFEFGFAFVDARVGEGDASGEIAVREGGDDWPRRTRSPSSTGTEASLPSSSVPIRTSSDTGSTRPAATTRVVGEAVAAWTMAGSLGLFLI